MGEAKRKKIHDEKCPISSVHKRMNEVHNLWHECLDKYFEPEPFRLSLNNLIQTLRNVTFHLQSQKDKIPDFDKWYSKWQQLMRKDSIMTWLNDARVTIVHKGDLKTDSYCRVSILTNYYGSIPIKFNADPSKTTNEIKKDDRVKKLPRDVKEFGSLQIERLWIADSLPNKELLEALAETYTFLSLLIADCHEHMNIPNMVLIDENRSCGIPRSYLKGGLSCMVITRDERTINVRFSSGPVSLETRKIEFDPTMRDKLLKRYGNVSITLPYKDLNTLTAEYLSYAKTLLKVDGYHIGMVTLFREKKIVQGLSLAHQDYGDKYLLWNHIANCVSREGADAILTVTELWFREPQEKHPEVLFSELPITGEAIAVHAVDSGGNFICRMNKFDRKDKTIEFGNDQEYTDEKHRNAWLFLYPVMKVWGLTPKEK